MAIVKIIVCVLSFIFTISYPLAITDENNDGYLDAATVKAIKSDLPSFIDLMVYLPLLNRVVDFCENHKNILTINLIHGLFLMSVNLEPFAKDADIPATIRNDLSRLLARSTHLRTVFNSGSGKMRKSLTTLTANSTLWSMRLPKLNLNLLKRTYAYGEYPPWNIYVSYVEDIFKGVPNPSESDVCVSALSDVPLISRVDDPVSQCILPDNCKKSIVNGTDFGYWLTHRFLIVSMAGLSRGCAIFSFHEDKLYRISFCEKAYREAQYIALNDYRVADLMLEQMALCALDGHAQFLRRSWLINLLEYQQTSGCFQLHKVRRDMENVTRCDDHATGVGAATYASAARFILEKMKRFNKL